MTDVILYGGRVRLTFDEAAHSYAVSVDGGEPELVPSVTQILGVIDKPALPRWAAKETAEYVARTLKPGVALDEIAIKNLVKDAKAAPWRKSGDAADIGTLVHAFAEDHALGKSPSLPHNEAARNACARFLEWWEANDVQPVAVERKVYDIRRKYAGTVDLLALINGNLAVADYKTSTGIWPEYALQLAAYAEAWETETGDGVEERWCLRFGKDGTFETKRYDWKSMRYDWDEEVYLPHADLLAFEAALSLHHWQQSTKSKGGAARKTA
jgi:hypothetical protein